MTTWGLIWWHTVSHQPWSPTGRQWMMVDHRVFGRDPWQRNPRGFFFIFFHHHHHHSSSHLAFATCITYLAMTYVNIMNEPRNWIWTFVHRREWLWYPSWFHYEERPHWCWCACVISHPVSSSLPPSNYELAGVVIFMRYLLCSGTKPDITIVKWCWWRPLGSYAQPRTK